MRNVWLITGANRGIGAAITKAALAAGHYVVAASRHPEAIADTFGDAPNLLALQLDVTSEAEAQCAIAQVVARYGRLDVLVNNAGYALLGALETTSDAEVRRLFDTNVFGLLNVTRAALPQLRQQQAGHIINISSMQGVIGAPASSSYSGSKFAVEGISESLHQEVRPLGIRVTLVEPGTFRTELLGDQSLHKAQATLPAYEPTAGQTLRGAAQRPPARRPSPAGRRHRAASRRSRATATLSGRFRCRAARNTGATPPPGRSGAVARFIRFY